MHPTTRLLIWFLLLVAIQCLDHQSMFLALLAMPLAGGLALRRWGQMAWGARWLFLSLFVILAWGGAGEPAWDGVVAPSLEGLSDAAMHVGRLLLVLMAVTLLRQTMPLPELLSAARALFDPLRRCGADPDRGLVRLLLVLRYLDTMPRPRDWRVLLEAPASRADEEFELTDRRLAPLDYLTVLLAAALVTAFCFWQA